MSDHVPVVTKAELERAYAAIDEIERKMIESSRVGRIAFFTEIQTQASDRTVPKFAKGATMSQAFRIGVDAGVEITLNSIDTCGILLTDHKERLLNVDLTGDGPDMLNIADMWAGYINS